MIQPLAGLLSSNVRRNIACQLTNSFTYKKKIGCWLVLRSWIRKFVACRLDSFTRAQEKTLPAGRLFQGQEKYDLLLELLESSTRKYVACRLESLQEYTFLSNWTFTYKKKKTILLTGFFHVYKTVPSNAHILTPFFQKTVFFSKVFFGKPPSKFLEVCLNSKYMWQWSPVYNFNSTRALKKLFSAGVEVTST